MKNACPLQSGAHRVTKITLRVLQKIKRYNQHDYRYGSLLTTVDPLRALRFLRWWMVNRRKWLADADTGLLEISRMIRATSFCSQQTSLHFIQHWIQQENVNKKTRRTKSGHNNAATV